MDMGISPKRILKKINKKAPDGAFFIGSFSKAILLLKQLEEFWRKADVFRIRLRKELRPTPDRCLWEERLPGENDV